METFKKAEENLKIIINNLSIKSIKALTSELITRQNSEMKSFENQLAEIEDDVLLKEILKLIKRAMNEFLSRNITCVIFYPKFTAEEGELIAHEWIKLAKESLRTGFV